MLVDSSSASTVVRGGVLAGNVVASAVEGKYVVACVVSISSLNCVESTTRK